MRVHEPPIGYVQYFNKQYYLIKIIFLLFSTVIKCDELANPTNGIVSLSDATNLNSVARYTCSQGYALSSGGDQLRFCRMDATWTGSQPQCVPGIALIKPSLR